MDRSREFREITKIVIFRNGTQDENVLKRCLFIFNALIFESRVEGGTPNLAAAPDGPDTCPCASANAASIAFFSSEAGIRNSTRGPRSGSLQSTESQLSSTANVVDSQSTIDRSITFCSSRMLPGHE
jgi:hypothetical protein